MVPYNRDADYKVRDTLGYSPIMTAIAANNFEVLLHMLKAILNRETDQSLKTILSLYAKNNKTVLEWAIESNHTSLIKVSKTHLHSIKFYHMHKCGDALGYHPA